MAIAVNIDETSVELVNVDLDRECVGDLANLKFRLALEGVEITTPVHGQLIRVAHPQYGTTHFNSWGTILDHCNEHWRTTYWGPNVKALASYNGDRDVDSPGADSSRCGMPVSHRL